MPGGVLGARNPTTIREHLAGHKINPLTEEMHDGEFYLVSCACGWKVAYLTLADAFALYADHLEANAVAALAILDAADTLHASTSLINPNLGPETVTHRIVPDPGVGAEHA